MRIVGVIEDREEFLPSSSAFQTSPSHPGSLQPVLFRLLLNSVYKHHWGFFEPLAVAIHQGRRVVFSLVFARRITRMKVKEQRGLTCTNVAFFLLSPSTMINHSEHKPASK